MPAIDIPDHETHMYVVKAGSPAMKMLRKAIPIKPGRILPCTDEQFESWENDVLRIPVVNSSSTD